MKRMVGISAAVWAALTLAGCSLLIPSNGGTWSSPTSAAPTATNTPQASETTEPIPLPSPVETNKLNGLPSSCDQLGSPATRATTVDIVQLYPDTPVPVIIQGADVQLTCYWFAGDVTGIDLAIAIVQEQDAVAVLEDAAMQGFTCGGQSGYTLCRLDEEADYYGNKYPVYSYYLYGSGVWLEAVGSNLDISTLIDEIAVSIWQ